MRKFSGASSATSTTATSGMITGKPPSDAPENLHVPRKIAETNALDKTRRFVYVGSLMSRKIDRNGRITEYAYDRFGRVKKERWLEEGQAVNVIRFDYDLWGNLQSVADNDYRIDYKRDAFGREIESAAKIDPNMVPIIQKAVYDKAGQRLSHEMGNKVTGYTYSPTGRITAIDWNGTPVEYTYDAAGRKTAVKIPAVTSTFAYDGVGRLAAIEHGNIARYDYNWDAADRIVSMNDGKYGYDKTDQLISADYDQLPAEKYEYDLNGNRSNFKTGSNNQLLHDGEFAYACDDEGNRILKACLTTRQTTEYNWDHRNRLVKVETPEETVEYSYDYQNRLVYRATPKEVEYFVHDGWQIVAVLDGNGVAKERFLWGARQDELLCENENFILADHLGTVRKIVTKDAQVASELEYDAFGRLLSASGTKPRFRYTVKMFDDATGLQWNINRWYDAKAGRWLSEDPIEFEAEDMNLARYAANNPIGHTDKKGLIKWKTAVCDPNQTYVPWPQTPSIVAEKCAVTSDKGNAIAAWRDLDKARKQYQCHGYTFGGDVAPTGPFAILPHSVKTIIDDEDWVRVQCCMVTTSGIALFFDTTALPIHSGKVTKNESPNGTFLESSILKSKWGQDIVREKTFEENVNMYQAMYICYDKKSNIKQGCCNGKGKHEIE